MCPDDKNKLKTIVSLGYEQNKRAGHKEVLAAELWAKSARSLAKKKKSFFFVFFFKETIRDKWMFSFIWTAGRVEMNNSWLL